MHFIQEYLELIDESIRASEIDKEPKKLYAPINYILNLGGKRLRPVFVLMGCEAFDGDLKQAVNPSLGVEYFHNFTLMHDDIMDNAPKRRGKETVHKVYGTNAAILSGDVMMIKSYEFFKDLEPDLYKNVVRLFNRTAITLCEGQQMDLDFETTMKVSYDEYIQMITNKTGVLGAMAFRIGAMIANAGYKEAKALYNFGLNLGIAFQLKDDFLDVFGDMGKFGKRQSGDIIENKKTILYVLAMDAASDAQKKELEYWYGMRTDNIDKVYSVEKIFQHLKVDQQCLELISHYNDVSQEFLNELGLEEEKLTPFRNLANYLLERQT